MGRGRIEEAAPEGIFMSKALSRLFKSFLKVGFIGFGGGSALVPVIEKEIAGLVSEEEYQEQTIVANITPGALPVKLAALVGAHGAGTYGMLLASTMVALPGAFLMISLLALVSQLGATAANWLSLASVGVSAFIIFLLAEYVIKTMRDSKMAAAFALALASLALSCGKELSSLIDVLGFDIPAFLPDFSAVELLKITIFIALFTEGRARSLKMALALALSAFSLVLAATGAIHAIVAANAFMLILSVFGVFSSCSKTSRQKPIDWKKASLRIAAWLAFTAALCAPALFALRGSALSFVLNGALSTATSFGGGEAYITIAENIFVDSGQISTSAFYERLAPIANALPGPILVKILSGIGFEIGRASGGPWIGALVAAAGFGAAIGVSNAVCIAIAAAYEAFSELELFKTLKQWVLPVISGLLASVSLAMAAESAKIAVSSGLSGTSGLALVTGLLLLIAFISRKLKANDLVMIISSALVSALALGFR
jgi:chromate transporter